MTYEARDSLGMYKRYHNKSGPGPSLMGANTLIGEDVYNAEDQKLGDIKEIMLTMSDGRVAYAVLSFGGFLGIGDKLFAVPWSVLTLDTNKKCFRMNVTKEQLKSAPGFDKDDWPDMSDPAWGRGITDFYANIGRAHH